jgi:hypothetical protein
MHWVGLGESRARFIDLIASADGITRTPTGEGVMDDYNSIDVSLAELFAAGDSPEPCKDCEAEVMMRIMCLLATDFPGLAPIHMLDWPAVREGVLAGYRRCGWHRALFYAQVQAMEWVFEHQRERSPDALDFALTVYSRLHEGGER